MNKVKLWNHIKAKKLKPPDKVRIKMICVTIKPLNG